MHDDHDTSTGWKIVGQVVPDFRFVLKERILIEEVSISRVDLRICSERIAGDRRRIARGHNQHPEDTGEQADPV